MRNNVIVIGFLAALSTAVYKSLDNFTVHNLITASDPLTAAFAYLIFGGWTGVIAGIIFSIFFGKKLIDPKFTRLIIINSQMHKQAFISGVISSGSMLFLLLGNQLGDPSVLIALGNLTIVYTLLYDILNRQTDAQHIYLSAIFTILGGMMAAFNGSLSITVLGLFYVVFISNGLTAISLISEQRGVRCSDSVSFFIWRFFWLAFSGTIIAVLTSFIRGYFNLLFDTLKDSLIYLPWSAITMFFVFLGMGLKFYLQKTQAVSVVLLILSTQLVLAYPITLVGNALKPGLFGYIPNHPVIWTIRIVGGALIIYGIFLLRRNKQHIA